MGVTVIFFSGMALLAVWWLSTQRLGSKPWLERGPSGEGPGTDAASARPVAVIGLWVLLVTISSLFTLFISAYLMRMQFVDWRPAPKPTLLLINTGVLMVSGAVLQLARTAADRDDIDGVRAALGFAFGAAVLFVAGQLLAWRQLSVAGLGLTSNPASSFFYLITGLHALHVLAGIAALGKSLVRAWRRPDIDELRLSLWLCSTYWDFLMLMWIILLGLLLLS